MFDAVPRGQVVGIFRGVPLGITEECSWLAETLRFTHRLTEAGAGRRDSGVDSLGRPSSNGPFTSCQAVNFGI